MKGKMETEKWKVSGELIVTEDDTICICTIEEDGGYEAPPEQRKKNKALIASAPDLLAALELCLPWIAKANEDGAFRNAAAPSRPAAVVALALEAISKAKGQT